VQLDQSVQLDRLDHKVLQAILELQAPLAQSVPQAQQGLQALMVPLAQLVQQVQVDQ
jgi:hypothetical protein